MMHHGRLSLALLTMLLACDRPAIVTTTSAPLEPRKIDAASPKIAVQTADGVEPERVQRMFGPAADPLKHCFHGKGGKVNIGVRNIGGRLELDVEPGASLDPTARACAMEALNRVYLAETGSNAGGVSVPPTNFTSILTVSW